MAGFFVCGLFHEVAQSGSARTREIAAPVFVTAPSARVVFVYVMAKAAAIEHRVVRRIMVVESSGIGDSEDSSSGNSGRRPSETFRRRPVQTVGRGRSTNFFIRSRCRKWELFATPDEFVRSVQDHRIARGARNGAFFRESKRV